jgi:hypothetical protein
MSKPVSVATGASRNSEVGHVWREIASGAQGTYEVDAYATIRVRATGATTVTIEGSLAATMSTGEIMIFNTGKSISGDLKETITLVIGGANAFVQVGQIVARS